VTKIVVEKIYFLEKRKFRYKMFEPNCGKTTKQKKIYIRKEKFWSNFGSLSQHSQSLEYCHAFKTLFRVIYSALDGDISISPHSNRMSFLINNFLFALYA